MLELLIICLFGSIAGWLISDTFTVGNEIVFLDIIAGFAGGYFGLILLGDIPLIENEFINHIVGSVSSGAIIAALLNLSIFVYGRRKQTL